ncbi:MAG TPA: DUF5668 domain-containing protein [Acidobacteriota bacterium]|nr:DUF5668 domain-containing protein [Acidobacteriota bacterium]
MNARQASILSPQLVLGFFVVLAGVMFTLDNLGYDLALDYLRYWPVVLVVLGTLFALQADQMPGRLGGLVLAVLGFVLLINEYFILRLDLWELWPLVLVFAGGLLIWQAVERRHDRPASVNAEDWVRSVAVLGGVEKASASSDFQGGELTVFMGGIELDLRQAQIMAEEAVVSVFVMWGGINIRVPEDWTVVVEGVPFMGGYADKTRQPREDGIKQRLIVRGTVIMGGAEIKN